MLLYMNSDFIPTKKKRTRYTFISPSEKSDDQVASDNINFYYQICTFPGPQTNKFHMRKFVINSKNEFIAINDYHLNKKQCKKFFAIKKPHEYKCYSVYSLDEVNYPNLSEVLTSKSDILSNSYDYTGFAPFTAG